MCHITTTKISLNHNAGKITMLQHLNLYLKADTGDVTYPLSGTTKTTFRSCDSQHPIIQLLRSNPENNSPFNILKYIKALKNKNCYCIISLCTTFLAFCTEVFHSSIQQGTSNHFRVLFPFRGPVQVTENYIGASFK